MKKILKIILILSIIIAAIWIFTKDKQEVEVLQEESKVINEGADEVAENSDLDLLISGLSAEIIDESIYNTYFEENGSIIKYLNEDFDENIVLSQNNDVYREGECLVFDYELEADGIWYGSALTYSESKTFVCDDPFNEQEVFDKDYSEFRILYKSGDLYILQADAYESSGVAVVNTDIEKIYFLDEFIDYMAVSTDGKVLFSWGSGGDSGFNIATSDNSQKKEFLNKDYKILDIVDFINGDFILKITDNVNYGNSYSDKKDYLGNLYFLKFDLGMIFQ